MSSTSQTVQQALAAAGVEGLPREMDSTTRTAKDAASALGCEVGAIASSLVFVGDGEPLLILTSGRHRVDTSKVAAAVGCERLVMATAEQVRGITGHAIGGVAPIGHKRPIRTLIDLSLADYPVVWAAAGTPHTVFPTTYEELRRVASAEEIQVV